MRARDAEGQMIVVARGAPDQYFVPVRRAKPARARHALRRFFRDGGARSFRLIVPVVLKCTERRLVFRSQSALQLNLLCFKLGQLFFQSGEPARYLLRRAPRLRIACETSRRLVLQRAVFINLQFDARSVFRIVIGDDDLIAAPLGAAYVGDEQLAYTLMLFRIAVRREVCEQSALQLATLRE